MDELRSFLEETLNTQLNKIIISNGKTKGGVNKIHIRPILLKEKVLFQAASYTEKQVFHENLTKEETINKIIALMEEYKQCEIDHEDKIITCLISKKGKVTIKAKNNVHKGEKSASKTELLSHNRKKKYLIPEGVPVPFLIDLGVMTEDGKIHDKMYDKYRQINRFLEFVEDILPALPKDREVTIIDFGCGKSYLTFAMYYYLNKLNGINVQMIGLDLKEDVIDKCNKLAVKYGYDKLKFLVGDIKDYEGVDKVDMVVTLHACDTATDYALYKAVTWDASVILSVPCCQHEMNKQLSGTYKDTDLAALMSYGIIRERVAALFTDAVRAEVLRDCGFDVQLLEFIDMEHTPKNILIRAVREKKKIEIKPNKKTYRDAIEYLKVTPMLLKLLDKER
ncbi:MAG: SAM-dependent methyltransferase [Lachnospiraceae bacterium]|nr:SAM-dependent methyltransferase [Lachnospiraceae bacterium]